MQDWNVQGRNSAIHFHHHHHIDVEAKFLFEFSTQNFSFDQARTGTKKWQLNSAQHTAILSHAKGRGVYMAWGRGVWEWHFDGIFSKF